MEDQINQCLHELNVLHDIIAYEYNEWDQDWFLMQVETAKDILIRLLGEE